MKYITQDWTSTKDGYLFLFKDYKKCCKLAFFHKSIYINKSP